MPLTLYFFQQFSLVSFIANAPAIPWIAWFIVPLCLLSALMCGIYLPFGQWLFKLAGFLLLPLWRFLQWLAEWPWAVCYHYVPSVLIMLIAILGLIWFFAQYKMRYRSLGLLGLIPLWFNSPAQPASGAIKLTTLDVGQGLAVVLQTAHHVMIYDTGMRMEDGFDAGRDVVDPYLKTLGIHKIDTMVISHGDNDHSGGAAALLERWPVKRVITSVPDRFPGSQAEFCHPGQNWQWDGVSFQMLAPPQGAPYLGNNSSCVLKVGGLGGEILLVGDIEAPEEKELIRRYGTHLKAAVLIVPHHGSRTSSTMNFLKTVQPDYAVFSEGYYNRFHFPAPSVLKRYQELEIASYLTSYNGAIVIDIPAKGKIQVNPSNRHEYFWQ